MDNINIRKVKNEDAEKWFALISLVWRIAYKDIFPESVFLDMEAKAEEKIKNFPKNYYNDDNKFVYVAEVEDKIVGVVFGRKISENAYFSEKNYADLQILYILPEYQSCGIATKFKDLFTKWLKNNNSKRFVIGVLKDNFKARNVYEKWGGKLDTHTEHFIRLGIGYEEVFYTYEI